MAEEERKDPTVGLGSVISFMLNPMVTLYRQNIERMVQPYGISAGQSPLMVILYKQDGLQQKELAQRLGVKPSSLTTMLNRMEKSELLERRRDQTDHRAYNIYLTPKGRRAAKKLEAVVRFINERNLAGFRPEEKILFRRFMEQMYGNMEKQQKELRQMMKEDMLLQEYRRNKKEREGQDGPDEVASYIFSDDFN